jgi:hypothetical protein
VDEWAIASLKFPGDILAQVATGVSVNQENVVKIFCSDGWIMLPNPWVSDGANPEAGKIILQRKGDAEPRTIGVEAEAPSFVYEADVVGRAISSRKTQAPAMTWNDSLGNARALDQWRESIGLLYDFEKRG